MAKRSLNYDSDLNKKQAQQEKRSGKFNFMKLDPKKSKLLILPGFEGEAWYKKTTVHEVWRGGKAIKKVTCAETQEEECPVCDFAWKLRAKYEKSKSEKKKELFKSFLPTRTNYCNAINLLLDEKISQVLRVPKVIFEEVMDNIDLLEEVKHIFDFDKGHAILVKGNGKTGKSVRYEKATFLGIDESGEINPSKALKLIKKELIDEDEIIDSMADLDALEPKFDAKALSLLLIDLKRSLLNESSGDEGEDDSDDMEEDDCKEIDGDDDLDISESDDEENDDEESEDDSDEIDEDEELDLPEDDDEENNDGDDEGEDDDFEEEEKPKKKQKKELKKKFTGKKKRKLSKR